MRVLEIEATLVGRAEKQTGFTGPWRSRAVMMLCALLLSYSGPLMAGEWTDLWLTRDQQGERLSAAGRYLEAADLFEDPVRKGVAFFRGGDFESAAAVFGRIGTPESAFNRGNCLVMLGRYEEAINSYEGALQDRRDWTEAEENLALARLRLDRMAPPDTDDGGTGGQLEADEIVFDDTGRVNKSGTETVAQGGEGLSDDEMRLVWLRRVQNDPVEFLRTRFAYQLYRSDQESQEGGDDE